MSMAEAYATFAARGIHCDPVIVSKITTRTGKLLEPPDANCKRVISKEVADGMNRLLGGVMKGRGTGFRARIPVIQNQAGKTGTINSNKAVWFNGYTPLIAGSAMIAIDPTKKIWKERTQAQRRGGLLRAEHRCGPRGFRQRRRRNEDLAARHDRGDERQAGRRVQGTAQLDA